MPSLLSSTTVSIWSLLLLLFCVSSPTHHLAAAASLDPTAECVPASERISCGDYSCNRSSHLCDLCVDDDGCSERALFCDTSSGTCELKSLKDAGNGLTVLAPLVAISVCAIGVVAGLGGGGILVPAYWLILGVPVTGAVGLSQITIVGQSVFNVFLQVQRQHPNHDGTDGTASMPLVNYEMMLLLLPFALVGTLLGKMAGTVSPDWLRAGLLVLLLSALMVRLIYLMVQQKKKDAAAREAKSNNNNNEEMAAVAEGKEDVSNNSGGAANEPITAGDDGGEDTTGQDPSDGTVAVPEEETTVSKREGDVEGVEASSPCLASMSRHSTHPANSKTQYPLVYIAIAVVVFCVQLMFSILRSQQVGVASCGSGAYIAIVVVAVIWNASASFATRGYLTYLRRQNAKGLLPPSVTPFHWTPVTTIVFPICALIAGGAAAWFGIGGGMVLNSLLLESEIVPAAVSATGGVTTMMTALQSAAIFIVDGELQWDYALVLLASGFIGTAIGQLVLMRKIREWGAQYLIIGALLVILVGSMVTQIAMGVYRTVRIADEGGSLGFGKLCK